MELVVKPAKKLVGSVTVPSDKSITHRAILLSALASGVSTITNPLLAEDCLSTARCVQNLGVRIQKKGRTWTVFGRGLWGFEPPKEPLDCGNSGTTMRLLSGVLAGQAFETTLFGDASLSKRPMDRVSIPLKQMGAELKLTKGKYAPFTIRGKKPLLALHWKNKISSAQVKSSLLLAGLHATGETVYEEPHLSRDHTERMLKAMGARLSIKNRRITLKPQPVLKPQHWDVPGDFSSAAFFIAAATLLHASRVRLHCVNLNPTRTGFLSILLKMGARPIIRKRVSGGEPIGTIDVRSTDRLKAVNLDPALVPHLIDEIPILSVLATQAEGRTVLGGIGDLRVKETDRIHAMAEGLRKMGACVQEEKDALIIEGPTALHGAVVNSYHDHRIAMSLGVAALMAEGPSTIRHAECVAISFPSFWTLLKKLAVRP